jgi:hypothetical protein
MTTTVPPASTEPAALDPAAAVAPDRPPSLARKAVRVLVTLGGFGVMGYLLYRVGWRDLVAAFQRIGVAPILLVLVTGWIENLVDCEALRRAMLGRVPLGWTIVASGTGGLVNTLIPFEAGEVVKATILRQHSTHSRVVSGLVIWNYVWKLAKPLALAVGFGGSLLLGHAFAKHLQLPVAVGIALSFTPYVALRILLHQRPAERLMRLLSRLPRLSRRAASWVAAGARLDEEVRTFGQHHRRAYRQVFGLTFVGRFISLPASMWLFDRLGLPSDLGSLLFLVAIQSVVDYATMVMPTRIGISEGSAYLLYQFLGLDPTAAIAMAILGRLRTVVVNGPPAIITAVSMRRQRRAAPAPSPDPSVPSSGAPAPVADPQVPSPDPPVPPPRPRGEG